MPSFITAWLRHSGRYRRGQYLEQAVKRAGGDVRMVDAALLAMVKSETPIGTIAPIRLAVRHQMTTEVHGLFLPCKIVKKN